jgi:NAD(P) transhydrogenase subunit alpha
MPEHASELYARNVQSLLELMLDEQGRLNPESEDEVLVRSCITREPEGDKH